MEQRSAGVVLATPPPPRARCPMRPAGEEPHHGPGAQRPGGPRRGPCRGGRGDDDDNDGGGAGGRRCGLRPFAIRGRFASAEAPGGRARAPRETRQGEGRAVQHGACVRLARQQGRIGQDLFSQSFAHLESRSRPRDCQSPHLYDHPLGEKEVAEAGRGTMACR